jgi:hypothetical protein
MEVREKSKSGVQESEAAGDLSMEITGHRIDKMHAVLEKLWRLQKKLINDLEANTAKEVNYFCKCAVNVVCNKFFHSKQFFTKLYRPWSDAFHLHTHRFIAKHLYANYSLSVLSI